MDNQSCDVCGTWMSNCEDGHMWDDEEDFGPCLCECHELTNTRTIPAAMEHITGPQ